MDLTRCDGPECRRCGCRQTKILAQPVSGSWFSCGRAECQHCGKVFIFYELPGAPNGNGTVPPPLEVQQPAIDSIRSDPVDVHASPPPVREICCPHCQSARVRVYSSPKTVRYYRCDECGGRFKLPKKPLRQVQDG